MLSVVLIASLIYYLTVPFLLCKFMVSIIHSWWLL